MYAVDIYTDGACSNNPGPAGVGIIIIDQYTKKKKEISKYIGHATNNIAEIKAVILSLAALKYPDKTNVTLHTDSQLVIGFVKNNWKPKKNKDLVDKMLKMIDTLNSFHIIKVKGHSDDVLNNRADQLAVQAIKKIAKER